MHVRALRGLIGDYGSVRRGEVIEVTDFRGQQLVKRGLVTPVMMEAAGTATKRPSERRTGGETGETKSASSLRPDRPPSTRRSKGSKAEPDSSQ